MFAKIGSVLNIISNERGRKIGQILKFANDYISLIDTYFQLSHFLNMIYSIKNKS